MQEGKEYIVKARAGKTRLTSGTNPPYPYWDQGRKVKCLAVYPNFAVVRVLPHHNPLQITEGLTEPYTVTIDNYDIGRDIKVKPC